MDTFWKVLTAMVTPFNEDYSVNYSEAAKLAKHLIDNGSDGIVVAGSTGEAATLAKEEKLKLFATVLEAVGDRAAVIAGTGSNDTRASIELTKEAERIGVHGAMLVGPYYNKPPQAGFVGHFQAIAGETALPLIIYNVPGRTASNILPETVCKLAEIKNIIAVKEASGNIDQVSEIIRSVPKDFFVYSGEDSLTLPVMSVGGVGVISVAAHIAGKQIREMIDEYLAGNILKARDIHLKLMPVFKTMFITTNPIPVKTAVNVLGFKAGPVRPPLIEANAADLEQIKEVMKITKQ